MLLISSLEGAFEGISINFQGNKRSAFDVIGYLIFTPQPQRAVRVLFFTHDVQMG